MPLQPFSHPYFFFPDRRAHPQTLSLPLCIAHLTSPSLSPSLTSCLRPSLRPSRVHLQELIRTWKAMTSTPHPTTTPHPMTTPTTAATAPTETDHRPVNLVGLLGPLVPQALASSTS